MAAGLARLLGVEQEHLKTLPRRKLSRMDHPEWFTNELIICYYSGEEPQPRDSDHVLPSEQKAGIVYHCGKCEMGVKREELVDGKYPQHARRIQKHELAEYRFEQICELLGLDPWSDGLLGAREVIRQASRNGSLEAQIAAVLPLITATLIRVDAGKSTHAAVKDLLEWTPEFSYPEGVEHDTPYFTETYLYEQLGKDEARTLLSKTRSLAAVTGYQGRVG